MSAYRVLVVDDQPHVVRVIRMALARKGYVVETAADGQQALEKFQESPFDVLITDIDMPRMTGQELCDAIHAGPRQAPRLTFVVSGSTDPDLTEWAEGLGQTYFLEKPMSLKHLTSLLAEHLDGANAA
jgi:CheY-like chemotaxis protein